MKIAYFDCFSGISGDMTIASFLDAGLDFSVLSRQLKKLRIGGYRLVSTKVKRGAISGTKFDVIVSGPSGHHDHRSVRSILSIIERSGLSDKVKVISKKVFTNIARAEAKVHGYRSKGDVWLHEVGELDSIVDIVGAAIAMDELGIDAIYASEISMGRTTVKTAHGTIPIPGPAAMELLKGAPVRIVGVDAELVTPTGAGILKTMVKGFGQMPLIKVTDIGYGAGSGNFPGLPNMLRVVIGETVPSYKEDSVFIVDANIDDMNPQYFEYVFDKLFTAGALDVYTTNILMKKGRPAYKLSVICDFDRLDRVRSVILNETTSIGIRYYPAGRFKLDRKIINVSTRYGRIRAKVCSSSDGVTNVSPEYDDCRRIADMKKIPIKRVYDTARETAYESV